MPRVVFDSRGNMAIKVGDVIGEHADYRDISTLILEVNGKIETYIAVTEYGLGCPPLEPETVYKITKA